MRKIIIFAVLALVGCSEDDCAERIKQQQENVSLCNGNPDCIEEVNRNFKGCD